MDRRAQYIRTHTPTLLLVQAIRAQGQDPGKLDLDQAIRTTAALYDRLDAAGFGDARSATARAPKARKTTDHTARMSEAQRAEFELFYRNYWRGGKPQGKQRAAARWLEINPAPELARRIIAAAQADAAIPRPDGVVRKYPEGWLSERRWEDAPLTGPGAADPAEARQARLRELLGERDALRRLHAAKPTPELLMSLARLAEELRGLGVAEDETPPTPGPTRRNGLRPLHKILTSECNSGGGD